MPERRMCSGSGSVDYGARGPWLDPIPVQGSLLWLILLAIPTYKITKDIRPERLDCEIETGVKKSVMQK